MATLESLGMLVKTDSSVPIKTIHDNGFVIDILSSHFIVHNFSDVQRDISVMKLIEYDNDLKLEK